MGPAATDSSKGDEVDALLKKGINDLLNIKGRLPLHKAIIDEVQRVGVETGDPVNDAVLQLVRDGFDMLVIDLASLREGLVARYGLLNKLNTCLPRLGRFTVEGLDREGIPYLEEERSAPEWQRERSADDRNKVFDRLFPACSLVTEEHVTDLIKRFRKDTHPTDRDRNEVRAHRFETPNAQWRQTLEMVEKQIAVFERYFNDLAFVLTLTHYCMDPLIYANPNQTAKDLVSLIMLGRADTCAK